MKRVKIYYNQLLRKENPIPFSSIPVEYQDAVKQLCKDDVAANKMPIQQYERLIGEPYTN